MLMLDNPFSEKSPQKICLDSVLKSRRKTDVSGIDDPKNDCLVESRLEYFIWRALPFKPDKVASSFVETNIYRDGNETFAKTSVSFLEKCKTQTEIFSSDYGKSNSTTRSNKQSLQSSLPNKPLSYYCTLYLPQGASKVNCRLWRFLPALLFIILLNAVTMEAYVLSLEGARHTYLHRRLAGRERRDVQREILSILGLHRRPRPNGIRTIEKTSAPLYMLGLYNSASSMLEREDAGGFEEFRDPYPQSRNDVGKASFSRSRYRGGPLSQQSRSAGPFTLDPMVDPFLTGIDPSLNRYITDSGILTNEVGVFETNLQSQPPSLVNGSISEGLPTDGIERQLLDYADVVMSFINTRPQHVPNYKAEPSAELKAILKRNRPFHFDTHQASPDDQLTAAKFRLYKDKSDQCAGNQTLRVNVYQAALENDGKTGIHLLGSRLVGSKQEGWIVYDVTAALRDWVQFFESNLGLKVSVETMDGTHLKPSKAGIVGKRGDPSKQAFIVAFFSRNDEEELRDRIRRRSRRSSDTTLMDETDAIDPDDEEDDLIEDDDEGGDIINDTEHIDGDRSDDAGNYIDDDVSDQHRTAIPGEEKVSLSNNVPGDDDELNEEPRTLSRRRTRARDKDQRARKKNRKRKRPKNSPKRKSSGEHCHRKHLFVNFRDLNWEDWIIAPPGYPAYYCSGECAFPLNAQMNATNHAIVQSLVHLVQRERGGTKIPKPCCSPTNLGAISVLYYNDHSNVVYRKYQDMVVMSCGCH